MRRWRGSEQVWLQPRHPKNPLQSVAVQILAACITSTLVQPSTTASLPTQALTMRKLANTATVLCNCSDCDIPCVSALALVTRQTAAVIYSMLHQAPRAVTFERAVNSRQQSLQLLHNCSRLRTQRRSPCAASQQDEAADSPQDIAVSQALTAIGLSGTIAVAGAALCGINLFGLFNWQRLQDIQLAVELNAVLILLDALLFVPSYSIPTALLEPAQAGSTSRPSQQQQQPKQFLDMTAVSTSSAWDPNSWRLMLAMLRTSIRQPQLQQLPLQVTAGLMVAREGSKELLQRGFFLTALAGWLSDRLYEADIGGLEGLVTLPGAVQATVPELGLLSASLAATALFAPAAFLAAEEAAAGVSGAMLLQTEAGSAVAAAAAAAAAKLKSRGSTAASSSNASSSTGAQTGSAAAAGGAGSAGEGEEEEEPLDPEVLEYRMVKVTEACLTSAPTQLAYRITLAKALGRLMLANVVFVVTQRNLAACFCGNLLVNVLLLVYARALQQSDEQQVAHM